jgi:membrane associated rhomboid family serine protease
MIGFSIENILGTWYKYLLLVLGSAIGGTIFSATVDPYNISVGSSTGLFGILACLCLWFCLNYKNLGPLKF